ncbi:DTW domain-containing protein YfiP [Bienertia sinuspersici]
MALAKNISKDVYQLGLDNEATLSESKCTSNVWENASMNFDYDGSLGVKRSPIGNFAEVFCHDSRAEYVGVIVLAKEEHMPKPCDVEMISKFNDLMSKDAMKENSKPLLSVKVRKYGEISNIFHQYKLLDNEKKPSKLDYFIAKLDFMECIAKGFMVKKLQKKQKISPRSILLFPAQNVVAVEAVNFEVKNLIVLDGTWAKANRMYNENPWLRLLPSVRLDVEKMSKFSEVRHQPKLGYLFTVKSIVYHYRH